MYILISIMVLMVMSSSIVVVLESICGVGSDGLVLLCDKVSMVLILFSIVLVTMLMIVVG